MRELFDQPNVIFGAGLFVALVVLVVLWAATRKDKDQS